MRLVATEVFLSCGQTTGKRAGRASAGKQRRPCLQLCSTFCDIEVGYREVAVNVAKEVVSCCGLCSHKAKNTASVELVILSGMTLSECTKMR